MARYDKRFDSESLSSLQKSDFDRLSSGEDVVGVGPRKDVQE